MSYIEEQVSSSRLFEGIIVSVRRDKARLCDGSVVNREVVEHPGGVTIIPVEEDGTVWCVRQYRYPIGREMLELPAGKLEYGEEHRGCAERELSEETGLTADELIYMGGSYTSPGFSTELLHIYLAMGLHKGRMHLDEGEFLNVERHSLAELLGMVERGEIQDAKTIIGILKAKQYLDRRSGSSY